MYKLIIMKEYTVIYFNEDGGCNIVFKSKEEILKFFDELVLDSKNVLDLFESSIEARYDSMYMGNSKYMIIKGLPILPKIQTKVTKLTI